MTEMTTTEAEAILARRKAEIEAEAVLDRARRDGHDKEREDQAARVTQRRTSAKEAVRAFVDECLLAREKMNRVPGVELYLDAGTVYPPSLTLAIEALEHAKRKLAGVPGLPDRNAEALATDQRRI